MPVSCKGPAQKGFTLIELSVVLVIIGLITAGIMTGLMLIHDAELKKVGRNLEKLRTAYYTFRTKYNAIPGDMVAPSQFWSIILPQGNGNGLIDVWTNEAGLAWQELSLAGLVEIQLNATTPYYVYGLTLVGNGVAYWYNGDRHNSLTRVGNTLSLTTAGGSGVDAHVVMSSPDAWRIDTKIDDGVPASGRFYGLPDMTGGISPSFGCYDITSPPYVYYGSNESLSYGCRVVYYVD